MAIKKTPANQLNFKYLLNTRQYLLIAIGFATASLLVFFSLMFPSIQSLQGKRAEFADEQQKLASLEKKVSLLSNIESLSAYGEREKINTLLPSNKPLLSVIQRLELISAETGVIVSGFVVSPGDISTGSAEVKKKSSDAKDQTAEKLDLQLNITGRMSNINGFLSAIETMTPLTDLTAISLAAVQRRQDLTPQDQALENTDPIFEARLSVSSYYFAKSVVQSRVDQALPDINQFDESVLTQLQQYRVFDSAPPVSTDVIQGGGKTNLFQ